jgi:hypothetical protein
LICFYLAFLTFLMQKMRSTLSVCLVRKSRIWTCQSYYSLFHEFTMQ